MDTKSASGIFQMTAKVISVAGVPVEVATPSDSGAGPVPIATQSVAGIVKGSDNIQIASDGSMLIPVATSGLAGIVTIGDGIKDINGQISLAAAALNSIGGVKAAMPVADVQTIQVTDIESAALAIAAIGTTLSELMQALRNAGIMEK